MTTPIEDDGLRTILARDVEKMISDWQDSCAAFPDIYNQGNVLLRRLAALRSSSAMREDRADWRDLDAIAEVVPSVRAGYARGTDAQVMSFVIAEIAKHLRSSPAVDGVGVKALVWQMENVDGTVWTGVAPMSGQYLVKHNGKAWEVVRGMLLVGVFDTRDEAKAAAQSDYETRVRSALSPTSSDRASVVEACAKVADVIADEKDVMAMSADESNFAAYREGERTAKQIAAAIRALSPRSS